MYIKYVHLLIRFFPKKVAKYFATFENLISPANPSFNPDTIISAIFSIFCHTGAHGKKRKKLEPFCFCCVLYNK
jgi:hypothetical protein